MRSKILAAVILCLFSGLSFANSAPKTLFKCVNLETYSVDGQCTSSFIAESKEFKASQKKLSLKMEHQNPNVMATVQFHPEKMLIKVISHRQLGSETKLIAMSH